ncbi:MAG: GNAT family N-acetyltransferase [Actinomycetia bacterium]|nr:GNAT family N-acetyltransferase [Actinomycetes bacterium]MCP4960246.1 GNAT family N-acetyltransferase [Actinomycetes bacterium]
METNVTSSVASVDLTIRSATADDIDAITSCVRAAYSLYATRMGKQPAPMLADYQQRVADRQAWVALVNDDVAGAIVMWARDDHLYVDNVAVDPERQGSGVGAALLGQAEQTAAELGFDEIRLYTNVAMTENLDYYPRRGFVETHRASEEGYERVYFSKRV